MKGFREAKKLTYKQLEELLEKSKEANNGFIQEANKRIDAVSNIANTLLFETGQDLASAECMVMMLKDLVWKVAKKEIYPHELKNWLEKFEAQESFEGTNEELAEQLGLSDLKRDYTEIYIEVEKRIANRMLDLDTAKMLNKSVN